MTHKAKEFYKTYHDQIADKRYNSPFLLRRYAHRATYDQLLHHIEPGQNVLDVGCGEGVLSVLMAGKGAFVTGVDLSAQNIRAAERLACELKVPSRFVIGDAEALPFKNNSFGIVVSSHVLEHLPNTMKGMAELHRVTSQLALIAMPTCMNPAAWALLGGDSYWKLSKRSLFAVPLGACRTLLAMLRGEEGPQEGYGGRDDLPHAWRFPWIMRRLIESAGFRIDRFEAGPLILPYLAQYVTSLHKLQPRIDRLRGVEILREFGYGSFAVCRKS